MRAERGKNSQENVERAQETGGRSRVHGTKERKERGGPGKESVGSGQGEGTTRETQVDCFEKKEHNERAADRVHAGPEQGRTEQEERGDVPDRTQAVTNAAVIAAREGETGQGESEY